MCSSDLKAEKALKGIVESEKISDPDYLEQMFLLHLNLDVGLRNFLRYLKVNRVPSDEINTKDDYSRRFFYVLYILNQSGGMRLVNPYLDILKPNRMLEYRFLGGMHFYNIQFEKSIQCYSEALNLYSGEYDEFSHKLIMGNLAAGNLYLENYDHYEHVKLESLKKTNSEPSIERIFKLLP